MSNIALAHLADLLTFLLVVRLPGMSVNMESNPVVRFVYENGGVVGMIGFKAVGVLTLIGLAALTPRGRKRTAVIVLASVGGLLGAFINTAAGVI